MTVDEALDWADRQSLPACLKAASVLAAEVRRLRAQESMSTEEWIASLEERFGQPGRGE